MESVAAKTLREFAESRGDEIVYTFFAKSSYDSFWEEDLYGVGTSNRLYRVPPRDGTISICNMNYLHSFSTLRGGFSVHVYDAQPPNEDNSFHIYPSKGAKEILKTLQQLQKKYYVNPYQQEQSTNVGDDFSKLNQLKQMLDAGLITQDDYEKVKKRILGI